MIELGIYLRSWSQQESEFEVGTYRWIEYAMQENKKNQVRLLGMCPEQLSGYWFYLLEAGKLEEADLG